MSTAPTCTIRAQWSNRRTGLRGFRFLLDVEKKTATLLGDKRRIMPHDFPEVHAIADDCPVGAYILQCEAIGDENLLEAMWSVMQTLPNEINPRVTMMRFLDPATYIEDFFANTRTATCPINDERHTFTVIW